MRIGVHLVMWQADLRSTWPSLLHRAAETGFDGVELSLVEMETIDSDSLRQMADGLGLAISCSFSLPPKLDMASEDERVGKAAVARLKRAVDLTAELGSSILVGPWYSGFGVTAGSGSERSARRERSADRVREVAAHSSGCGVVLGLEPLNRYETDLINTVGQARRYIERADSGTVGICLDTFHASMEEESLTEAISSCGSLLVHLHCAANHRGIPGSGSVDWVGVFEALRAQRFDGSCVVEVVARSDTEVARRLHIWRDLCPSPEVAARQSARFLKRAMDGSV